MQPRSYVFIHHNRNRQSCDIPFYGYSMIFCWIFLQWFSGHRRCVRSSRGVKRTHPQRKNFSLIMHGQDLKNPSPYLPRSLTLVSVSSLVLSRSLLLVVAMLLQAVLLGGFAWALWQIIRPYVVKSPLDVVPGPPSKSFLSGESLVAGYPRSILMVFPSGNLEQLFDRDAWGFHDEVGQNYGPIVKINAVLGVSAVVNATFASLHLVHRRANGFTSLILLRCAALC